MRSSTTNVITVYFLSCLLHAYKISSFLKNTVLILLMLHWTLENFLTAVGWKPKVIAVLLCILMFSAVNHCNLQSVACVVYRLMKQLQTTCKFCQQMCRLHGSWSAVGHIHGQLSRQDRSCVVWYTVAVQQWFTRMCEKVGRNLLAASQQANVMNQQNQQIFFHSWILSFS